jgi:hypothetical protein
MRRSGSVSSPNRCADSAPAVRMWRESSGDLQADAVRPEGRLQSYWLAIARAH